MYIKVVSFVTIYYNIHRMKQNQIIVEFKDDIIFGYDDIAFFDEDNNILSCTTTHERYIFTNEKL